MAGGRYVKLSVLVVLLLAAGTMVVVSNPREDFARDRVHLIRQLAVTVRACIGRVDPRARDSAMFHGCGDWHNALAGQYALYTAYLRTGDRTNLRVAERQIRADRIDAELAFLPQLQNPQNWRRYYGFPWLLAMLRQRDIALAAARRRGEAAGDGTDLRPLAVPAVTWLRDWLTGLDAGRGRQHALTDSYTNLSWALVNLIRWARHTGDRALLDLARTTVDTHLRPAALDTACPVGRDTGADVLGFIPPCLLRLAVVAELDGATAKDWIDARIPAGFAVPPLARPRTAEATGLNFHRAAMLWTLAEVTGRAELRDNSAMLIRFHTARPYQWRDDYRRHAQWIPQFGIHAIEQSYPATAGAGP